VRSITIPAFWGRWSGSTLAKRCGHAHVFDERHDGGITIRGEPMLRSLTFIVPLALGLAAGLPGASAAQSLPPAETPVPATLAERAPAAHDMLEALRLYDILDVMAASGVEGAMSLEADLFPGMGGAAWAAEANRINGADRVARLFEEAFAEDMMSADDVARVTAFFEAEPGRSIAAAEVAGRRAFLDPASEELAKEAFREAVAAGDPRIDVLTEFVEANDLVERNVSGALNSNFAFYRGLSDGGAFEVEIPEDLMLAEVWGQEAEIRRDTVEWLYAFLLAAYSGIDAADIEAYTAFSETEAGIALNAALFEAFDSVFETLSYELGVAAARFIAGEDA
jgi:hypothetical protein